MAADVDVDRQFDALVEQYRRELHEHYLPAIDAAHPQVVETLRRLERATSPRLRASYAAAAVVSALLLAASSLWLAADPAGILPGLALLSCGWLTAWAGGTWLGLRTNLRVNRVALAELLALRDDVAQSAVRSALNVGTDAVDAYWADAARQARRGS